jgi:kinetochore protein Spc24, fungi type
LYFSKAIRELRSIIDPEEDYLTIIAAEESVAANEARRKKDLEESHALMKCTCKYVSGRYQQPHSFSLALAKTLEAARISSTRPASVLSAEAHAAMLNDLDGSRLSLAKSISELDGLIASREGELAALKEETRLLEEYDPAAEHQKELDGTAYVFFTPLVPY